MMNTTALVVALFNRLLNKSGFKTDMENVQTLKNKKAKRVWEVDFLRGFCMLFVIWDHLMFDFGFLFSFSTIESNSAASNVMLEGSLMSDHCLCFQECSLFL